MTRPPRVGILTSVHGALDPRIFKKEARTLVAAGFEVHLVVPHDRDETVDGVQIHGIPRPASRLRRMLGLPQRVLREALRLHADLYHFHDPELIPVGLALKALGKRVIYDAHEDLPKSILGKSYLPRWSRRPLAAATAMVEKGAARAFDRVIVARDDIVEAFRGGVPPLLIRNFPERKAFAVAGTRGRRPDDDFVVIYIGGLTPGRGAVELIEAVGLVPERCRARLVIYGKFWPADLEARLRAMPGFARVEYHGWVDHQAIPEILASADAGIVCFLPEPNNVNAGPTKLFEYLAAGLPVVASNFPLWRDLIEGRDCGICVNPTQAQEIASALEYLADHPDRGIEMGERGRRTVLTEFTWEVDGERLVNAYRELLSRPADPEA